MEKDQQPIEVNYVVCLKVIYAKEEKKDQECGIRMSESIVLSRRTSLRRQNLSQVFKEVRERAMCILIEEHSRQREQQMPKAGI